MKPKERLFFQLVEEGYYSIDGEGNIWMERPRTGAKRFERRIKWLETNKDEYLRFHFNCQGRHYSICHHRIVYIHRHGDIPEGMQINHIDGDRQNNDLSNLEMVTPRENSLHAFNVIKTNKNYGENCRRAKFARSDVLCIYMMHWEERKTYGEIAEKYGIFKHHASEIYRFRSWRHLWRTDGKVG